MSNGLMNFHIHLNALQWYPEKLSSARNNYLGKKNYIQQKLMEQFKIRWQDVSRTRTILII